VKRLAPAAPWLGILLLSVLLPLPNSQGQLTYLPQLCTFKATTGHPCPGCGLTRSFVCLGHGDLSESVRFHPLGPMLFLGVVCALILALIRLKKPAFLRCWRLDLPALGLLTLALLILWPLRLLGKLPSPP
jgi:hypothetical protein